jgi:hypothetical protein
MRFAVHMASNVSHLGQFGPVVQSFKETLSEEQRSNFEFSTLEDFQTTVVTIQNRQGSEKKMRNLARLRCFLEAMEQYGKVIEVFVNTSEIVGFIWVYHATLAVFRCYYVLSLTGLTSSLGPRKVSSSGRNVLPFREVNYIQLIPLRLLVPIRKHLTPFLMLINRLEKVCPCYLSMKRFSNVIPTCEKYWH